MPKVFQWDCYGDFRKNIIHIEIVVEFSKKKVLKAILKI